MCLITCSRLEFWDCRLWRSGLWIFFKIWSSGVNNLLISLSCFSNFSTSSTFHTRCPLVSLWARFTISLCNKGILIYLGSLEKTSMCNISFCMLSGSSRAINKVEKRWMIYCRNGINRSKIRGKTLPKCLKHTNKNFSNRKNSAKKMTMKANPLPIQTWRRLKSKKWRKNQLNNHLLSFRVCRI